jgi:hypothetical protein
MAEKLLCRKTLKKYNILSQCVREKRGKNVVKGIDMNRYRILMMYL